MTDEEMAEEYRKAKSECKAKITKVIKAWSAREEAIHDVSFKDGAEFGYNRAKEEVKAPYPSYKHLFGESIEQTALRHSNDLINSLRGDIDYAKTIIQDLLNNSDEYARQRAMDFAVS